MAQVEIPLGQALDGQVKFWVSYQDDTLASGRVYVTSVRAINGSGRPFKVYITPTGRPTITVNVPAGETQRSLPPNHFSLVQVDPEGDPEALAFDGAIGFASEAATAKVR